MWIEWRLSFPPQFSTDSRITISFYRANIFNPILHLILILISTATLFSQEKWFRNSWRSCLKTIVNINFVLSSVKKLFGNQDSFPRVHSNVQIEARVHRHGEITVAGVPVRRALVARGFRGRSSLWVIFPKILCGVLAYGGSAKIQFTACGRTGEWCRVMLCHVMTAHRGASCRVASRRVVPRRMGTTSPRRLAPCFGLVFSRRTTVHEDGKTRLDVPVHDTFEKRCCASIAAPAAADRRRAGRLRCRLLSRGTKEPFVRRRFAR